MPKGYTTKADLAKYLGRTFSSDENDIADMCIEAAEETIDDKTGHIYAVSGPQTMNIYEPDNGLIVLPGMGPYTNISVNGYTLFNAAPYLLELQAQYEVRDAERGILYVLYPSNFHRLEITYTPSASVRTKIKLAANILAAHWMRPILNDEVPGLANYSIAGEFSVAFSQYVQERGYPSEVDSLLGVPALYIA